MLLQPVSPGIRCGGTRAVVTWATSVPGRPVCPTISRLVAHLLRYSASSLGQPRCTSSEDLPVPGRFTILREVRRGFGFVRGQRIACPTTARSDPAEPLPGQEKLAIFLVRPRGSLDPAGALSWGAKSRVEEWRGGETLRFHSPLIKLDGRFSRIRLSDKATHTFAHEQLALGSLKLDKAQLLVQVSRPGSVSSPDPAP